MVGIAFGSQRRAGVVVASASVLALAAPALAGVAPPRVIEQVDVSSGEEPGNLPSFGAAVSADGRFVAFRSFSTNLVANDTNRSTDVFLRNRVTGQTRLISVSTRGRPAARSGQGSDVDAISPNGRYVLFTSSASNLVPGDTNNTIDVFLRDRWRGRTERVSVGNRRRQAEQSSCCGSLSADGRYVAFASRARNLVRGDANRTTDVYVRDRRLRRTILVSVRTSGSLARCSNGSPLPLSCYASEDPSISANGRVVVFTSQASNLVRGDTNRKKDVFARDLITRQTRRVSVRTNGRQFPWSSEAADISANGRIVAFQSGFPVMRHQIYVRRRAARVTEPVSVNRAGRLTSRWLTGAPSLSARGRYVAFDTNAPRPGEAGTPPDSDVVVRDRVAGVTRRITRAAIGGEPDSDSLQLDISANGNWVAFYSTATNLTPAGSNGVGHVYIRRR